MTTLPKFSIVVATLLIAVTAAVDAAGRRTTPLRAGEFAVDGKIR